MDIKQNRIIYTSIKEFIFKYFPDNSLELKVYEDCFYITVYSSENENSQVWFEFDMGNSELIVGFGSSHIHYGKQYGIGITEGINRLLDFFTTKLRRTDYYKGRLNFKSVYEIKQENGIYEALGITTLLFLYPFWEQTTKKVTVQPELIKDRVIKAELEKLRTIINTEYQ